jgi:hypothetical protein
MQPSITQFDVAGECAECGQVAAFDAAPFAACLAATMPLRSLRHLGHDRSVLNGRAQFLGLGDRHAEVLRRFSRLRERRDLLGRATAAIVVGDLEQDPDPHGVPPMPSGDE